MIDRTKFRRLHYLTIQTDLSEAPQRQRAFLIGAITYYRSSKLLQSENSMPGYMLGLHAIELGLKAFLLSKGESFQSVRKLYGHSLKHLYIAARKKGFSLQLEHAADLIEWFDELHSKHPSSSTAAPMRYEFIDVPSLPHIEYVLKIAQEIIELQQGWS